MRSLWTLFLGGALSGCNVVSGLSDFEVTPAETPPSSQSAVPLWGRAYGETLSSLGRAVACDAAGNIFVGGSTSGELSFGGSVLPPSVSWDAVVAKLAPDGTHLWSVAFTGRGDQMIEALAVTPDGDVVVVGTFVTEIIIDGTRHPEVIDTIDEDSFVARLEGSDGTREWSKTFGGASAQRGRSIAVYPTGELLIAGDFFDGINIEAAWIPGAGPALGTSDVFMVRLAADGTYLSHGAIGDAANDNARALAINASNHAFLGIEFEGTLAMSAPLTAAGHDAAVIKIAEPAMPAVLWQAHFTGTGPQRLSGIAADPAGGAIIAGTFTGNVTVGGETALANREAAFVTALDPAGSPVWLRHFLGAVRAGGASLVALDVAGNSLLTGGFTSWMTVETEMLFAERSLAAEPTRDTFLLKLDPLGDALWSTSFGSMGEDAGTSVAFDPTGNALLVGDLDGSATLGEQPISTSADLAILLAKFAP